MGKAQNFLTAPRKSGSKMNRKTPNLDPRSSVTPNAIDLKFGTLDYVVGATQHAKN